MGSERRPKTEVPKPKEAARIETTIQLLKGITTEDVAIFGLELHQTGLLSKLEESLIIPAAHDPNPHGFEVEREAHERWWNDHPAEGARFESEWEARTSALKYLYIGVLLGNLFPTWFLPQSDDPRESALRSNGSFGPCS
jgi:hypothetical protein